MKKISYAYWTVAAVALALPNLVFAACTNTSSTSGGNVPNEPNAVALQNPLCFNSISDLINAVIKLVGELGAIVAVLMFIYAGFLYITAQGSEDKIKDAHKVFRNAAIGTAILLGASVIALIIQTTISTIQTRSGI